MYIHHVEELVEKMMGVLAVRIIGGFLAGLVGGVVAGLAGECPSVSL